MITCKKCGGPVEKRIPNRTLKAGQEFYFEYYHKCAGKCGTTWMPPKEDRVYIDREKQIKQVKILHEKIGKILRNL